MKAHPRRSLRALDWLNFFMADVNTGIGPFLAIYLTATRHWNPASVGVVVSAQSIASVLAQGPAGWIVDWSQHKNWLVVGGAAVVAFGCAVVVQAPDETAEILNQILIGIAAALFPPAIAAISLGIVGKERLSRRIGRNESFNHAGNVSFALLAGAAGTWLGQKWIFYMSAVVAIGTMLAAANIRSRDIDNVAARAAASRRTAFQGQGRQIVFLHVSLHCCRSLCHDTVAALTGRLADSWGRNRFSSPVSAYSLFAAYSTHLGKARCICLQCKAWTE
jgi:MFS family permease